MLLNCGRVSLWQHSCTVLGRRQRSAQVQNGEMFQDARLYEGRECMYQALCWLRYCLLGITWFNLHNSRGRSVDSTRWHLAFKFYSETVAVCCLENPFFWGGTVLAQVKRYLFGINWDYRIWCLVTFCFLSLVIGTLTHLVDITASQELRYDWEAELSGTRSRSRVEFWVLRVYHYIF